MNNVVCYLQDKIEKYESIAHSPKKICFQSGNDDESTAYEYISEFNATYTL